MNQGNNFNVQSNNENLNNQDLNNINQNFNNTFNQQPQPTPSFQQSTPQTIKTLENGNANSQNINLLQSKKKKLGLIIGIIGITIVIVTVIGIMIFSNEDEKSSGIGNNNNNNNSLKNSDIQEISITNGDIVALTNEGDLYHIGDESYAHGSEDYKKLRKIATSVEKFYNNNNAVYFIDKQHDLYYFGESYNGGGSDEVKKDYSNVNDIVAYMNLCGFVINHNNELYAKSAVSGYCGLNNKYDEFTKLADDVKEAFTDGYYGGYINNNNELYLATYTSTKFEKIADNVSSIVTYDFDKIFILTVDNKLSIYKIAYSNDDNNELKLLREDVSELGENYFKTINGEYNVLSSRSDLGLIKGESKILYDGKNPIYYGTLAASDIKEILYYVNSTYYDSVKYDEQKKLIYIATDGKIVLLDQNGKKTLNYNTNSLNEIFEFVIAKNIVED